MSASAWAGPLSLWVGQKQTLYIFQRISKIEISNQDVLKSSRVPGVGLSLKAVGTGVADVKISCTDGTSYAFRVHATNGAEVYSTNRSEPEHYQWSLSSTPKAKEKVAAADAKAKKAKRLA
ncbi:MAG TPA: hypothetical protein VND93_19975 [Myxococcales bacterium]|nr:hypothetical protein [Myxococcales bacterium]